jgi:DMSO/TMAO reductase YedYZ molybdopterin-dependent catalytic subunit
MLLLLHRPHLQASIPIKKALSRDGDVLIAYEMNDSPIPSQHG